MSERKTLTVTELKPVEKVGQKQIPKLSFRAKDGETEHWYQTFRSSLFDAIKEGETITADVEISTREYQGQEYTDRKVTQIYRDGQPVGGKQFRGKSPEELELSAKSYVLSYAKDLAVADKIAVGDILPQADIFYSWIKGNQVTTNKTPEPEANTETVPSGRRIQNIAELKRLLMKHKIPTGEACEILSIKAFTDLLDLDEAWETIKKARNIE